MRVLRILGLISWMVVAMTRASAAQEAAREVAPGLAEDALVGAAGDALDTVVASLEPREREALRGIYVAVDPSPTDVAALAACDDDGDYVIALSRGLLTLLVNVAYGGASDALRGTHLLEAYGPFLARAQLEGARPLPLPLPPSATPSTPRAAADASVVQATQAFVRDALAWLVADEVAHAALGEFVCTNPTVTHEHGDDVWTADERARAIAWAPACMARMSAADAWATAKVLGRGGSEAPALALFEVLAPLEDANARAAAAAPRAERSAPGWTYLTLHPGTTERGALVRGAARDWRGVRASESSPRRSGMR